MVLIITCTKNLNRGVTNASTIGIALNRADTSVRLYKYSIEVILIFNWFLLIYFIHLNTTLVMDKLNGFKLRYFIWKTQGILLASREGNSVEPLPYRKPAGRMLSSRKWLDQHLWGGGKWFEVSDLNTHWLLSLLVKSTENSGLNFEQISELKSASLFVKSGHGSLHFKHRCRIIYTK